MATQLTHLRVFIASPGGLEAERRTFREEINEFNESDAIARGVFFQPVGWEDTLGGIGRPQAIINEDIRCADFFVLVLWNRWGSPPEANSSRFSSGTEEEFHFALDCVDRKTLRQMVLMFRSLDVEQLSKPDDQVKRVLEFRTGIERAKTHLFHGFDTTDAFRKLIRRHLSAWLRREEADEDVRMDTPSRVARPPSHADEAESIAAAAWTLAEEGRLTEAEVAFARLAVDDPSPEPLIEYGRFLYRVGRLDQAAGMFEAALSRATEQHDDALLARAHRGIGRIKETRGDMQTAEARYRQALQISERLAISKDPSAARDGLIGVATAYVNLGAVLEKRGDPGSAEAMYRRALEINQKLNRPAGASNAYANLGNLLRVRGDWKEAERMHRQALEIAEDLKRPEDIAKFSSNLGSVLQLLKDYSGAEAMHRQALAINERLGRLEGLSKSYGNLGNLLSARGEVKKAEEMYRKSLEIDDRLGRQVGVANTHLNLGGLLFDQGEIDAAEPLYRRALEIYERLGLMEGIAITYSSLGEVFARRGDAQTAEQMYKKSLEAATRLQSTDLIREAETLLAKLAGR